MIENGRPRYWIDWYDRWYLPLPLVLIAVIAVIWRLPVPPVASLPISPGISASRLLQSSAPRATPARPGLTPPVLESPLNGKGFFPNRIADAEGHAEPGVNIHLEYAGVDLVWHELSFMPTDAAGRFHFQLRNFPPGSYRLRARAMANDGRSAFSAEAMITIAPEPVREVRRRRARK